MGFEKAFLNYGFTWLLGLLSFIFGVIVFYMKPGSESSRAFLLATFTAGIFLTFTYTSRLSPDWLNIMLILGSTFSSATVFHLAVVFPAEQKWVEGRRSLLAVPYAVAAILFTALLLSTDIYADAPGYLLYTTELLRAATLLFFLGSIFFTVIRATSPNARVRAKVVLFGAAVALTVPVLQLFSGILFDIRIVSHPALYMPFYMFLPLTIAFSIVKHNLFDVDVFIKRTVGYGLMTGFVGALYVGLALSMKPATRLFPLLEEASGLYPVLFALLVLFFFRPIHNRLQSAVDRIFFRGKLDYKDAVISLSNELTTVLDLKEVIVRIIHAVRDVMSIDSAGVILLQPEVGECPALFIHDPPGRVKKEEAEVHIDDDCLDLDDPLVLLVAGEQKLVTRYDIAEDPRYGDVKESCLRRLNDLNGTMALPLIFQGRITGILVLGRKKSGRFYIREDIDLLNTLANQGAIAIENAKRAERMKDEEVVRANLARYLSPQVVEQVISKSVDMDLDGGRKNVAVLISDIRDFTQLTKAQPPDRLVAILNEYFTEMAGIIFEHQGSLDKYIGDAIVAVFGSLIDLENPTSNAVKTAIDMINRMARLNESWSDKYDGLSIEIGIGIDTGEVFLGNVGSPERMEFTVLGSAVNTADHMSRSARPRQILLSEAAAAALGGKVDVRILEPEGAELKKGKPVVLEVVP
jgi:adenylate cyclase